MKLTPMMSQYFEIKENYKDCILFFRLGDFYEMFFDDAKTASRELELVLNRKRLWFRRKSTYVRNSISCICFIYPKISTKGYKVAICEQVEDRKCMLKE